MQNIKTNETYLLHCTDILKYNFAQIIAEKTLHKIIAENTKNCGADYIQIFHPGLKINSS